MIWESVKSVKLNLEELNNEVRAFSKLGLDAHVTYNSRLERVCLAVERSEEPKGDRIYAWAAWDKKNWWLSDEGIHYSRLIEQYPGCSDLLEQIMPDSFEIRGGKILAKLAASAGTIASLFFFLNSLGILNLKIKEVYG